MSKILIIDDEEDIVEWLREYLESVRGDVVLIASQPSEGLRLIEEAKPDLVLLDLMMPEMNGLELLEKARSKNMDFSCIVLTGRQEQEFKERAETLGVSHFLTKPVALDEVKSLIDTLMPA